MAASDHADDVPRLGTVVRFKLEAASTGVRELESGGFRVASSRDSIPSLPERLITHYQIECTANVGFKRAAVRFGVDASRHA